MAKGAVADTSLPTIDEERKIHHRATTPLDVLRRSKKAVYEQSTSKTSDEGSSNFRRRTVGSKWQAQSRVSLDREDNDDNNDHFHFRRRIVASKTSDDPVTRHLERVTNK